MELYKVLLTNNESCYAVGKDEMDARDKIKDWLEIRYVQSVSISSMELIADSLSKGFVDKLVL